MILTCPDCSTRYTVKDDAVGPNGRTVRCSNCHSSWFVTPDPDVMAFADNQRDDIIDVVRDAEPEPAVYREPAMAGGPKPVMGAHVHIRDRADRERRNRRLMGISMIWIVTLGILFIAAMTALAFRQAIVDRTPSASAVYKVLGLDVKLGGLDLEDPTTRNILIDGRPVLVVNGNILNNSRQIQDVPLIRLSLHDNSGEELIHWMVEPPQSSIEAKQRLEYVSQFPNPPIDAISLKYRFENDIWVSSLEEKTAD